MSANVISPVTYNNTEATVSGSFAVPRQPGICRRISRRDSRMSLLRLAWRRRDDHRGNNRTTRLVLLYSPLPRAPYTVGGICRKSWGRRHALPFPRALRDVPVRFRRIRMLSRRRRPILSFRVDRPIKPPTASLVSVIILENRKAKS